ncbi:MAG: tetratricopeptide repeat protein [Hyphomicrobiales bacterium]
MKVSRLLAAVSLVSLTLLPVAAGATTSTDTSILATGSLSGSYLAGRAAGKERDNATAAAYFARALELDPNNPVLIERAFFLELGAGNLDKANELAQQVVGFNSQHRIARTVMGLSAFKKGDYKAARENFQKASFTPVGELTSGLLIAWSYAGEKNLTEALRALDILDKQEAFANFKLFHAALITDYLNGEATDARYRTTMDKAGNSLRVVQAYGNYLDRTKGADAAKKVYESFLAEDSPRNPLVLEALNDLKPGEKPKRFITSASDGAAEALFSLASSLSDEQSIDVALVYAQLANWMKPNFDVAQTLLGEIYEDMGRHQQAIEAYQDVAKNPVLTSSAEIQIAGNLDALDRKDEAVKVLTVLVDKNPKNFEALLALGNLQRSNEKWTEAADAYTKSIAALGPDFGKRQWSVLYFRGIALERAGQWDKAEADFRKALELEPDQPQVLNYLGYSLIEKRKDLDEAMSMVRKAVELRPNDGYIVDSLGWAYYQLGDYEEAARQLERAVELRPEDPVINDHYGDALWRVGRKLEAKFQWQHAKDNKPEPKDLAVIEKKLKDGLPDLPPATPAASGDTQKKL